MDKHTSYVLDIAKSRAAVCKGQCKQKIDKDEIRLVTNTEGGPFPMSQKRHLFCVTSRVWSNAVKAHGTLENIPGFYNLSDEAQETVQEAYAEAMGGITKAGAGPGADREQKKAQMPADQEEREAAKTAAQAGKERVKAEKAAERERVKQEKAAAKAAAAADKERAKQEKAAERERAKQEKAAERERAKQEKAAERERAKQEKAAAKAVAAPLERGGPGGEEAPGAGWNEGGGEVQREAAEPAEGAAGAAGEAYDEAEDGLEVEEPPAGPTGAAGDAGLPHLVPSHNAELEGAERQGADGEEAGEPVPAAAEAKKPAKQAAAAGGKRGRPLSKAAAASAPADVAEQGEGAEGDERAQAKRANKGGGRKASDGGAPSGRSTRGKAPAWK